MEKRSRFGHPSCRRGFVVMKKLIILVPDKNTQYVLMGLLPRLHRNLSLESGDYDIYTHPLRDPGIYNDAHNFLRNFAKDYRYAIVFMDREGSGQERKDTETIRMELIQNLERNGWKSRAEVIIIDPELEVWAWTNSKQLAKNLGWTKFDDLKKFVIKMGFWKENDVKPTRPKEAIETALREKRIPRSSAIYKKVAASIAFDQCKDPSFNKFKKTLFKWFNPEDP